MLSELSNKTEQEIFENGVAFYSKGLFSEAKNCFLSIKENKEIKKKAEVYISMIDNINGFVNYEMLNP